MSTKKIFNHFFELSHESQRVFKDFFNKENPMLAVAEQHWTPNVDVYQTAQGIILKAELPGVPAESIELFFQGNTIHIKGKRHDHAVPERLNCHQLEISYGDFYRTVPLPAGLETENASAKSKDGFLLVLIPFRKEVEIPITMISDNKKRK